MMNETQRFYLKVSQDLSLYVCLCVLEQHIFLNICTIKDMISSLIKKTQSNPTG